MALLTLGFGAAVVATVGMGLFAGGVLAAGSMMATGSALTGASAGLHESDRDTSDQLFTAGVLIGGVGTLGAGALGGVETLVVGRMPAL